VSGFSLPTAGNISVSNGRPPTPVVPRERVDPAYAAELRRLEKEARKARELVREAGERGERHEARSKPPGAGLSKYQRYRRRKRQRFAAIAEDIAERFPASEGGKRANWPRLAVSLARKPYRPLQWHGRLVGMDHASVIYAIRQMGLRVPDRSSSAFRDMRIRDREARRRDLARKRVRHRDAEKRLRRAELERTLAGKGEFILNSYASLSIPEVREIKSRLLALESTEKLAAEFRVNSATIHRIRRGENWKRVPWPSPPPWLP
jgi:hypothetical protein